MAFCYFTYDEKTNQKVWIPGCMGAAMDYNGQYPEGCCECRNNRLAACKVEPFVNKKELIEENELLRKENASLHRIIDKLKT